MTIAKWEKLKRLEKIEEIRKRRETAQKIPEIETPENWWWRESQKEQPESEPPSTTTQPPRNVLISSLLQEIEMQETAQTAIVRVHDVSQQGHEIGNPSIQQPPHDVPHATQAMR
jgi:hypothetical protein